MLKFSNQFHNIANFVIAITGGITFVMLATGCVQVATGLDCSASFLNEWFNPAVTAGIATGLAAVKSIVNVARDGLSGLFKTQPPVQ